MERGNRRQMDARWRKKANERNENEGNVEGKKQEGSEVRGIREDRLAKKEGKKIKSRNK